MGLWERNYLSSPLGDSLQDYISEPITIKPHFLIRSSDIVLMYSLRLCGDVYVTLPTHIHCAI